MVLVDKKLESKVNGNFCNSPSRKGNKPSEEYKNENLSCRICDKFRPAIFHTALNERVLDVEIIILKFGIFDKLVFLLIGFLRNGYFIALLF